MFCTTTTTTRRRMSRSDKARPFGTWRASGMDAGHCFRYPVIAPRNSRQINCVDGTKFLDHKNARSSPSDSNFSGTETWYLKRTCHKHHKRTRATGGCSPLHRARLATHPSMFGSSRLRSFQCPHRTLKQQPDRSCTAEDEATCGFTTA